MLRDIMSTLKTDIRKPNSITGAHVNSQRCVFPLLLFSFIIYTFIDKLLQGKKKPLLAIGVFRKVASTIHYLMYWKDKNAIPFIEHLFSLRPVLN